ncbi:hypothetical protein [Nocardioides sp. GXZ039]|uniref:hypothetical protein n=1 Tax=Nocardioides sp. GXZ039 TaxID=3136018 RepID=UPI0030F38102
MSSFDVQARRSPLIVGIQSSVIFAIISGSTVTPWTGVRYLYIECQAPIDLLDSRLRDRRRLPSQRPSVGVPQDGANGEGERDGRALFATWVEGMKRPKTPYLLLDTSRPLEVCQTDVLEYLRRP